MDKATIIGLVAGTLTTLSFIPQLIKIVRSKSTHDISLVMYIVFSTGILLWLIYGLLISDVPVIVANAVALFITITILSLKVRYR
ncbi:MAG: SemiSWEET transporter [bacterium]|nr:SemiSWEET transporter [bacterium]